MLYYKRAGWGFVGILVAVLLLELISLVLVKKKAPKKSEEEEEKEKNKEIKIVKNKHYDPEYEIFNAKTNRDADGKNKNKILNKVVPIFDIKSR